MSGKGIVSAGRQWWHHRKTETPGEWAMPAGTGW
jgi:hypothetical protein